MTEGKSGYKDNRTPQQRKADTAFNMAYADYERHLRTNYLGSTVTFKEAMRAIFIFQPFMRALVEGTDLDEVENPDRVQEAVNRFAEMHGPLVDRRAVTFDPGLGANRKRAELWHEVMKSILSKVDWGKNFQVSTEHAIVEQAATVADFAVREWDKRKRHG